MPDSFYDGSTGIEPVDITIRKLLKSGYNHHIERLMILGNFMLLCEIDPNEIYNWWDESICRRRIDEHKTVYKLL